MDRNPEYDIYKAMQRIENELIQSMIRNFDRHRAEEKKERYSWTAWQAEQLKALEQYKQRNLKKYQGVFGKLNSDIESMIRLMRQTGRASQEIGILEALKKGYRRHKEIKSAKIEGRFFKVNDRKLNALIKATMNDMEKAEQAVLRMANDKYRKAIFAAQIYANTGAGTYEKAVDMATKDMLSAGLNCVEYKNGARHTLANYARMAIKTANKRAYLMGEGEKRAEWGVHTVILKKRGNACPLCLPFVGKVLIDDVYSGGSKADGNYPLLSAAMAAGLYHPNCKDIHTTYFPGISTPPEGVNKEDVEKAKEDYTNEQKQNYCKNNTERFQRMSENSLDPDNKRKYAARAKEWEEKEKFYQKIAGEDNGSTIQNKIGRSKNQIDNLTRNNPPISLNDIKSEYRKELIDIIENAPVIVKDITVKNMDKIYFAKINALGRNRYNPKNGIFVNLKKDMKDSRGKWVGVFHEAGHNIDHILGNISYKTPDFKNALIKDFENVVKSYQKTYNCDIKEVYSDIGEKLQDAQYHSVSDIVGGITNNDCIGGYGHFNTEYWNRPHALEKEAFAHFYEAYVRNDIKKIELLREMFPSATQEFFRLLR